MSIRHIAMSFASLLALSACGGSSGGGGVNGATTSGFRSVDSIQNLALGSSEVGSVTSSAIRLNGGPGYAYGLRAGTNGAAGYAAVISDSTVLQRPPPGQAVYDADFAIAEVRDTRSSTDITETEGTIVLRADFVRNTISGSGNGLQVSGTIDPQKNILSGDVVWRGTDGEFAGRATESLLIGAFHGHDDTHVYAGGLSGFSR